MTTTSSPNQGLERPKKTAILLAEKIVELITTGGLGVGDHLPPEREMVENAIVDFTATGVDPSVLAERAFEGIRENRFYVLSPDEDPWRVACNRRLDDIRNARNPGQDVNELVQET